MWLRERGLDLEGSARKRCGSAGHQRARVLRAHSRPLSRREIRAGWRVEPSAALPLVVLVLLLLSTGLQDAPAAGSHGDKELCCRWRWPHAPTFAGCTLLLQPKAPNAEANPSPPSMQTPQGTQQTGANSSQSQPEIHSLSKGVMLNPTIKSPSSLDAPITRQGPAERLQKHKLKSQNVTQI